MTSERPPREDGPDPVAGALRSMVVPDHRDGFWTNLDAILDRRPFPVIADDPDDPRRVRLVRSAAATAPAADPSGDDDTGDAGAGYDGSGYDGSAHDGSGGTLVELDDSAPARRRRGRSLLAAVAGVIAVAGVTLAVATQTDRGATPVASPAPTTASAPTSSVSASTTTAVSASVASALATANRYMAALASGDVTTAASLLGPRSQAYLKASTNGVVPFLTSAKDGMASWATATGKTAIPAEIRAGDVVVTYVGTRQVEGVTRRDAYALPLRHAESANAWFVEPYAFDAAIGGRMDLLEPAAGTDGLRHVGASGIQVGVATTGTVYFGDGNSVVGVPVTGTARTATWKGAVVPDATVPSTVTATFVSETIFISIAFFVSH